MIENPPNFELSADVFQISLDSKNAQTIAKINREYLYWDEVKYQVPSKVNPKSFWSAVKLSRLGVFYNFCDCTFSLKETNYMQELLHEFDMNFGGTLSSENLINKKNQYYYLLSSVMEEAIASSQMEGAVTTRKVAKEMLKKQLKPKDKSQQMIVNNYKTIRFLAEQKDSPLTKELLLEVHKKITEKTLDDPKDEGKFRTKDNIVVMNGINGEVAHEPPSCKKIKKVIQQICDFANKDEPFVHPIIKAIMIHFMISFLHPFIDGNGRTARSLFYWFMLKKNYWLTEFLSISRIIYKSKVQYEKAFLYTEHDNYDLGYFVQYNLSTLKKAFDELKIYLNKKKEEEIFLLDFKIIKGINERQAQILKICTDKPNTIFISRELENTFNVSVKTIRSDLEGLVKLKLLESIPMNNRLVGYKKTKSFEKKIEEIRGN